MIQCPECAIENTDDSNFCRHCGARLRGPYASQQEETTEGYGPAEREADDLAAPPPLTVAEGTVLQIRAPIDREGELVALYGDAVTIGRNPQCDLFLDDVTVSRKHARLVLDGGRYMIEDQGSLNGTYVNRRRIERHQLFDGDEVQVGKFKLAFLEHKDNVW